MHCQAAHLSDACSRRSPAVSRPQESDEVRRTLAKMLHALVLTIVFGSIAMAEPLP
jgi:hypothetical protein